MQINKPEELIVAVDHLLQAMDKKMRKEFLLWVKFKRKEYDLTFPLGGHNGQTEPASTGVDSAVSNSSEQPIRTEPSEGSAKQDSPIEVANK